MDMRKRIIDFFKEAAFRTVAYAGTVFPASQRAALICPPASAPGSLGDEAMIKALVGELRKNGFSHLGILEMGSSTAWQEATEVDAGVPAPSASLGGWLRFLLALKAYSHVYVIGADCIDGNYSVTGSRRLLRLADFCARAGRNTTITGCSFNASADPLIIETIDRLDRRVRLLARDPMSHSRITALTTHHAELVADLAFLLKPSPQHAAETIDWIRRERAAGRTVLGVNLGASALGTNDRSTILKCVDAFAHALGNRLETDAMLSIVLLPHDFRGESSDLAMCEKLRESLSSRFGARVRLFDEHVGASAIKAVAGELDACVTCRMHLAIACLGNGVPVGAVTYQDKFEGLFGHLGITPPAISGMQATDAAAVAKLVDGTLAEAVSIRETLAGTLQRVRALSERNVPFSNRQHAIG